MGSKPSTVKKAIIHFDLGLTIECCRPEPAVTPTESICLSYVENCKAVD